MGKVRSKNIAESNSTQEVQNQYFLEKLADKEQVIETILECTLTGFWEWDILEEKLFFNKNLLDILGYNENEISNEPSSFAKIILAQDYQSPIKLRVKSDQHCITTRKTNNPIYPR